MTIDTAYVRNEPNMPQYMFAVGVTVVPAKHIEDTLVIYRNGKPSLALADSIKKIESAGNHNIPTENTGKWIAIKNGVPVVASYLTTS